MLNGFHILTITHRDAPLSVIAQAVLPEQTAVERLAVLKSRFGWEELMYLATCNRVTYIFYTDKVANAGLALETLRLTRPELPESSLEQLARATRLLHGAEAVNHVLELSASIDSLVVGESEILRQIREAYEQSRDWKLTGDHLRLLIGFAVETAKDIYTQTAIGEGALSVVALAFSAMLDNGIRPTDRVVLIGAGQTNTLFGKFLLKNGFQNVTIFNRSRERAEILAQMGQWKGRALSDIPHFSEGFDVLVVCTGATEPIVTTPVFHQLLGGEYAKKVVVDLALPHNVAQEVIDTFPIQYIDIESLRAIADENRLSREDARASARSIVSERLPLFHERWQERQVERLLSYIPEAVQAVKDRAMQDVFAKKIAQLDAPSQALVQEMMDYMQKKFVAIPIKAAKTVAAVAGEGRRKT